MDREFWQSIIDHNYQVPQDVPLSDMLVELLNYLSSPDPEQRDRFAYGILARWIISQRAIPESDLSAIAEWLLPKLEVRLGEQNTDSVFGRSYAALILSLIVYRDSQTPFLSDDEVRLLLDQARHYLIKERDLRAYIPDKGFANACANTADWLRFLVAHPALDLDDLRRVLNALSDKLITNETVALHLYDEDDRLAHLTAKVFKRDLLDINEIRDWVQRFGDWYEEQDWDDDFDAFRHAKYQNIKTFLRALYVHLMLDGYMASDVEDFMPDLLGIINLFKV